MDATWIDQRLAYLSHHFIPVTQSWTLFNPTPQFYARLESGEDDDLVYASEQLACHLKLASHPSVTYEWGLRLDPQIAGQIQLKRGLQSRSHIQIPLFCVGKPEALGAILAHELSHEAVAQEQLVCANLEELEYLTDLTSLVLGLGKLVLNGIDIEVGIQTGEVQSLGYLKPELKAYAYEKVKQLHQVSDKTAYSNLTKLALSILTIKNVI
jgi:hypothetical protein